MVSFYLEVGQLCFPWGQGKPLAHSALAASHPVPWRCSLETLLSVTERNLLLRELAGSTMCVRVLASRWPRGLLLVTEHHRTIDCSGRPLSLASDFRKPRPLFFLEWPRIMAVQ